MKLFLTLQTALLLEFVAVAVTAFSTNKIVERRTISHSNSRTVALAPNTRIPTPLYSSADGGDASVATATNDEGNNNEDEVIDYEIPEDAVIDIKPKAMKRLRELREKQKDRDAFMVLRMGVRNGGCSGLSYVMDFSTEDEIQEDDEIDEYSAEKLKCVVDAKSMLYLYGLELDYSEDLIGGGFKFFNPNAEESCGCGSSFGV
jgi:iron-sulfur cluster assembly protein